MKLVLSDGSCFFVTAQALAELGLGAPASGTLSPDLQVSPGAEISEAALAGLQRQAGILAARDKALDLLDASAHSEASLRLKLRKRGFPAEAVDEATSWLSARGLLDDRRFAESWLSARLERHPEGRTALLAGLRRRGVPRAVAEEAVRRTVDAAVEREAAQRLLAKLRRQQGPGRSALSEQMLWRRLAARGFSRSLVRSLLEESE